MQWMAISQWLSCGPGVGSSCLGQVGIGWKWRLGQATDFISTRPSVLNVAVDYRIGVSGASLLCPSLSSDLLVVEEQRIELTQTFLQKSVEVQKLALSDSLRLQPGA